MNDPHTPRTWPSRLSLAATLLLGVVACTLGSRRDVGVHEWWSGDGPVVPHDNFPADCGICHAGGDWTSLREDFEFDHEAETGVALEGAHASASCLRCHNDRGPVQTFAARGCAGCHENVHRGQLGANCEDCHSQVDWRPNGEIARHARTGFPLIGSHAATACWRCHPGAEAGDFARTDTECVTCHADDLARTTDPDHIANGWVDSCDRCHVPTTWNGAGFKHTTFPLTGRHCQANCSECHSAGFSGTPNQCVDCHLAEYQSTTNPDHTQSNFPMSCETCHGTSGWLGASFPHLTWPLTGAHKRADCLDCHTSGVFAGLPNQCEDCHLAEYQTTTNPNHTTAGFPTSCDLCHTTRKWQGASFAHNSWPLTGRHAQAGCQECHASGVYAGLPNQCEDCHLAEYQSTTNPNHISAGFPTTCDVCHDTSSWLGANFNHSFPINSGKHKRLDCSDCHMNPNNYMQFSCIDCHEHRKSKMDSEHKGVGGYSWSSPACLSCHPDGKE